MNEVNAITSGGSSVERTTSAGKVNVGPVEPVGKPVQADLAEHKATVSTKKDESYSSEDIKQALATMNDYVQSIQRDLQFSIDDELDTTVIKVVDSKSGEVIRQIPDATLLELARALAKDGHVQLLDASG